MKVDILEYKVLEHIKALSKLHYGDYAFIHPKRSDGGGYWLPRIDYPASDNICYYMRAFNRKTSRVDGRLKIETFIANDKSYHSVVTFLSQKEFYKKDVLDCWGRSALESNIALDESLFESVSNKSPISGKSPQHYIAIRANIHMERILFMLSSS